MYQFNFAVTNHDTHETAMIRCTSPNPINCEKVEQTARHLNHASFFCCNDFAGRMNYVASGVTSAFQFSVELFIADSTATYVDGKTDTTYVA